MASSAKLTVAAVAVAGGSLGAVCLALSMPAGLARTCLSIAAGLTTAVLIACICYLRWRIRHFDSDGAAEIKVLVVAHLDFSTVYLGRGCGLLTPLNSNNAIDLVRQLCVSDSLLANAFADASVTAASFKSLGIESPEAHVVEVALLARGAQILRRSSGISECLISDILWSEPKRMSALLRLLRVMRSRFSQRPISADLLPVEADVRPLHAEVVPAA